MVLLKNLYEKMTDSTSDVLPILKDLIDISIQNPTDLFYYTNLAVTHLRNNEYQDV